MQDEIDHLIDRDSSIMICIRQAKNRGWHSAIAEDLVKCVGSDRIILAYKISNGFQKFDDIDAVITRSFSFGMISVTKNDEL